jgi:hypothetical protein
MEMQPGATFVGRIFLALNANNEPVSLVGYTPYAKVRKEPDGPVLVDLNPEILVPDPLTNPVTVELNSYVLSSVAHGMYMGTNVEFSSTGDMPQPLRAGERYIVLAQGLEPDQFSVVSFHTALLGGRTPLRIQSLGTGTLTATLTHGQVRIPEISDEETELVEEEDAFWELMLEDPGGRRLAPFMVGHFPIKRGLTP